MLPIRSGAPCYVPLSASCFYTLCDIRHLLLDRSAEPHTFSRVVVSTGGTSTSTAAAGGLVWGLVWGSAASTRWFGRSAWRWGSSTWGSCTWVARHIHEVAGWRIRLG